ncbi:MAG: copper amine oxidase N-terminal domain-containing protein [Ruminococcaceae bacterium]|nr:copper amine oxidase N-terminal domain-containing protein [Oscillospiraceae bacterium]
MKLTKRAGALLLAGTMLLSSAAAVMAEDTTESEVVTQVAETVEQAVLEPTLYQVGDFVKDEENWTYAADSVVFEDGKLNFIPKGKSFITYTGSKMGDGAVQLNATFNFNDGNAWGGFAIRCVNDTAVSWSGNHSYLVVVKKSQIELQRYNTSGNKFLTIVENDGLIEENKPCNITLGSIEVNGGVQVFMYADDKLVFNCFDGDGKANTNEGYLSVYGGAGVSVDAYEKETLATIPAGFALVKTENTLTAPIPAVISFGEEAGEYVVTWGKNDVYQGELTELQAAGAKEFAGYNPVGIYPEAEAQEDGYVLTEADDNKYITAYVKDANGALLCFADAFYNDTVEKEKEKMIILLTECEYSYVFGEKVMIDPDDAWVVPTIENDRTLVPIRFISESLGAEVTWDPETSSVIITQEDTTIEMQLGKKEYTVNGEVKEMDAEATIIRDRTMVPLRVISETFGKNVFWDPKGLIIISDEAPVWDSVEDEEIIDKIIEEIKLFA